MTENKCPFCGETKKNMGVHARHCKKNPANIKPEPIDLKGVPLAHNIDEIKEIMNDRIITHPTPEPVLKEKDIIQPPFTAPVTTFKAFSENTTTTIKNKSWWQFWKKDNSKKEIVSSPLELKKQILPKWAISEIKPYLFNPKKRKRLTQLVFHSRRPPYQEFMWVDTDELVISVGHKGFKLPAAIHSGIVHWDAD